MKLWPTRTKYSAEPLTDLDAIIAESVSFRFSGKIHTLRPISLEEFLKFTNAQAKLLFKLKNLEHKVTVDELVMLYHNVISSVCDSITEDDIRRMEQVQVAALYQLVIDLVTGQVRPGEEQKKSRKKIPIYESVQPSSSPSVQENSDGPTPEH